MDTAIATGQALLAAPPVRHTEPAADSLTNAGPTPPSVTGKSGSAPAPLATGPGSPGLADEWLSREAAILAAYEPGESLQFFYPADLLRALVSEVIAHRAASHTEPDRATAILERDRRRYRALIQKNEERDPAYKSGFTYEDGCYDAVDGVLRQLRAAAPDVQPTPAEPTP